MTAKVERSQHPPQRSGPAKTSKKRGELDKPPLYAFARGLHLIAWSDRRSDGDEPHAVDADEA
jgi:hypothetical protein